MSLMLPSRRAPDGHSESHYSTSMFQLREAILAVLYDGDPLGDPFNVNGETVSGWSFDMPDSPIENERRLRFCDAVEERLRQ